MHEHSFTHIIGTLIRAFSKNWKSAMKDPFQKTQIQQIQYYVEGKQVVKSELILLLII